MSALNIAIVVALILALAAWACVAWSECRIRWPWMSRAKAEAYAHELLETLDQARALVPIEDQEQLQELERIKGELQDLARKMPPPDILAMAHAIGGDMSVKQIAYKQLLTKRNNVTVKLAAAYLVRLLREKGEQDSQIYQACESLVELGCVDPDDTEGLRQAGNRFAIEGEVLGDHPAVPELGRYRGDGPPLKPETDA